MACVHVTPGNIYYKRHHQKQNHPSRNLMGQPLHRRCELCFIYGVWRRYAIDVYPNSHQILQPRNHAGLQIDEARFEEALNMESVVFTKRMPRQSISLVQPQAKSFTEEPSEVELESGQFGEAYHVVICQLLLDRTADEVQTRNKIRVVYRNCPQDASKQRWIQEIKDLIDWYPVRSQRIQEQGVTHSRISKERTTRIIAAAFRSADNQTITRHRERNNQSDIFRLIRDSLGLMLEETVTPWQSILKCITPYLCPSYAAKYWLHRYFRLTEQCGRSEAGRRSGHAFKGMPKRGQVGMVAVIHIRRTPVHGSLVKREMDEDNLNDVLDALKEANRLCFFSCQHKPRISSRSFTHVILYGDFSYAEALQLRENAEDRLGSGAERRLEAAEAANRTLGPNSYSSSPFALPKAKLKKLKTHVRNLGRAQIKGPTKINVLFISRPWEAPPGVVNGGDLASTRVFEFWQNFRDHRIDRLPLQVKILGIWTALRERYGENICVIGHRSGFIEAAGFIGMPVFYLNNERLTMGSTAAQQCRLLFDASAVKCPEDDRLRELADVMNTFIPVEVLEGDESKPETPFRVASGLEKELRAAVFMFMCCLTDSGMPAWTERVKLMHERNGKRWLQERFNFAMG